MTLPRASTAYRSLGRAVFRRAGTQTRTQAWKQATRRQYATEHAKKSSDLPWMIGSAAFTIPAAVWLMGQAPKTGGHHDEHHEEKAEEKEEPAEEESEAKEEEAPSGEDSDKDGEEKESTEEKPDKSEGKSDEKKDDKEDESKDEDKEENSDDSSSEGEDDKGTPDTSDDEDNKLDGHEKPGANAPGQTNFKPGSGKGPSEGQKGSRKPNETKGEKDSQGDKSGAKHPYLDDDEKSKKNDGSKLKETAKIQGTVDSNRPAR